MDAELLEKLKEAFNSYNDCNYITQDRDGSLWGYIDTPRFDVDFWVWSGSGCCPDFRPFVFAKIQSDYATKIYTREEIMNTVTPEAKPEKGRFDRFFDFIMLDSAPPEVSSAIELLTKQGYKVTKEIN